MIDHWTAPVIPRWLSTPLRTVRHPDDIVDVAGDGSRGTAVADWAETAQPASLRAKVIAEPYLETHLAAAATIARARGRHVALWTSIPAALFLVVVSLLILAVR